LEAKDSTTDDRWLAWETRAVNFSEQPPSKQWAALKYRGEKIAEVWFKPEGEPFALLFRVPHGSFQIPGVAQQLSPESLLKAVGIAADEVESWRCEGAVDAASELGHPLPPPPDDDAHLDLQVRLKPPANESALSPAASERGEAGTPTPEVPAEKWQDLEVRWRAILGLEANIDALRLRMDSVRVELESSLKKTLTPDERVHALNADVAQWNKAKSRAHFALPKAKEFIHRATWADGAPEKKKLDDIFKNQIQPRIPFPELDKVPEQLDYLQKLRQVLSAQGTTVYQECQTVLASIQSTLRTLQTNAAAIAANRKFTRGTKGKYF
jgi:hypothetical protein